MITEQDLEEIKKWPIDDWKGLIGRIVSLWEYPKYVKVDGNLFELHTGGWSENEEIISALQENQMFWCLTWSRIERGGHYYFDLKDIRRIYRGKNE